MQTEFHQTKTRVMSTLVLHARISVRKPFKWILISTCFLSPSLHNLRRSRGGTPRGNRGGRGVGGGTGRGRGRGGRGRGRGGRNKSPAPNADQLDAELDAWKQVGMQANSRENNIQLL